ncbi:hypothetical protein SO802_034624 [Lithocarpus litseifolius]|uniref:hAT-like transposase RNase-H fold domain-containing protein n=1 Tax=Lithocarpus litseifolius TaxID=425828 RepID=A0AAW2BJT2_9ROSI
MLVEAIIKHNLPFSFVENEGIRKVFNYLNSDVKHIFMNILKANVLKLYKKEKVDVKKKLKSIPDRICLTSDLWTSVTSEGYICLTAHYVDENWELKNIILNFCPMPPSHTGTLLTEKILSFLEEWGIEKKIFSITLDNASNNDNCQDFIKKKLNEGGLLLCDGIFFHVRCGAHILNLIVQEGLKVIDDLVIKIRETMKYLKGSKIRMCRFDECAKIVGMKRTKGLCLDVCTRWNATYDMIDSAIRYRSMLNCLAEKYVNLKHCPSRDEWNRVERITRFLKHFNVITTLFSRTDYPIANQYFQGLSQIELLLLEEMESQDSFISNMAEHMKGKFNKYWDCYSVVLACAIVLDPRYKLDYVDLFSRI